MRIRFETVISAVCAAITFAAIYVVRCIAGDKRLLVASAATAAALAITGATFAAEATGPPPKGRTVASARLPLPRNSGNQRPAEQGAPQPKQSPQPAQSAHAPAADPAQSWVVPVHHYTLSAGFNQAGSLWSHRHSGQDFAVPTGTPVEAVHRGTVVEADWGGAYGNNIVIRHEDGYYTQYGHLSAFRVFVGQQVSAGQTIALSGSTGNSTGPHLHFEVRTTPYYGSEVEPLSFLRQHGVNV